MTKRECGFEKRELKPSYWGDPRWQEVSRLRADGKQPEANNLTFKIREDWGMD